MSPKTSLIFGPPGTGKTTALIGIVSALLAENVPAERICYVGFTRRSAKEARDRAAEKFNLSPEELINFRTLHSMAFHMQGLNSSQVMNLRDYVAICNALGLSMTLRQVNEDGTFAGQTKGDRLMFAEMMSRSRMIPLKEYWESIPDEDIYYYELLQLHETLAQYKLDRDKRDFTDVIHDYVHKAHRIPDCDVLIVDEAQDLTPLQWLMVDKLSNKIGETHVAGDDDQAIFRWAGADVEHIIKMPGSRRVLDKSYRVPRAVQALAIEVSARISNRVPKEWAPRDAEGVVERVNSLDEVDMGQGSWLLLARNAYLLESYVDHCLRDGLIFEAKGIESLINGEGFEAIKIWEALRKGYQIYAAQARALYNYMGTKTSVAYGFMGKINDLPEKTLLGIRDLQERHGLLRRVEEPWDVALDKLSRPEREYFLAAIRRGESLEAKSRIRISTIHGAKGAEADNVVLQLDMAERTFREFEKLPDDEHRCWYVGITRARERLILISPMTNRSYDI